MPSFKAFGLKHPRPKSGVPCWCCAHISPKICNEIRAGFASGLTATQAVAWLKDDYKIVLPFKGASARLREHLRLCGRKRGQ